MIRKAERYDVTKNKLWEKLPPATRKAIENIKDKGEQQERFEEELVWYVLMQDMPMLESKTLLEIAEEFPDMTIKEAVNEAVKRLKRGENPMILQGRFTNSLKSIGRKIRESKEIRHPTKGTIGSTISGGEVYFKTYETVGALPMAAQKVFDMLIEKVTHSVPHGLRDITEQEAAKYTTHEITLKEYMSFTGLKDRKEASRQLAEGLSALFNAVVNASYTIVKGKASQEVISKGAILQWYEYKRGKGTATFTNKVMQGLIGTSSLMPWNRNAYRINGKNNPNSYYFASKLMSHYHMNNKKPNAKRISVKTLLDGAPSLPDYQEISKSDRALTRRIIEPFERDMENLRQLEVIDAWEYCNSKGVPLTESQVDIKDYETFCSLFVSFELKNFPEPDTKNGGYRTA